MHIPADAADQGKPENTTSGIEVLLRTNYSSHLVFVCSWPSSALATTTDFENLIVLCRLSFQKACSPPGIQPGDEQQASINEAL